MVTMTAKIAGFISRADWGARAPRSVSRNITPGRGGCTKHYGGPPPTIRTHSDCVRTWKGWQNYHMDTHGWVDIAYTAGFCQHGYVLAGRGYGIRTAANGTNTSNQNYYAFTWIGGEGQTPTRAALDALDWLILDARKNGGAGLDIKNHRDQNKTACPGNPLAAYKPLSTPSTPEKEEEDMKWIIAQEGGTPKIWVGDGINRRHVDSPQTLLDIKDVARRAGIEVVDLGEVGNINAIGHQVGEAVWLYPIAKAGPEEASVGPAAAYAFLQHAAVHAALAAKTEGGVPSLETIENLMRQALTNILTPKE